MPSALTANTTDGYRALPIAVRRCGGPAQAWLPRPITAPDRNSQGLTPKIPEEFPGQQGRGSRPGVRSCIATFLAMGQQLGKTTWPDIRC